MNILLPNDISLTEFQRTDREALLEWLNEQEIYRQTLRIPSPYTEEAADAWFQFLEQKRRPTGWPAPWAIREAAGRVIGSIGIEGGAHFAAHRAEIGYWLARPYWGRGIATAAVQAVCAYAFRELKIAKVTAHVFAGNDRSARVLEKCGFIHEGTLKQHFQKQDQVIDVLLYGLFAPTPND